MSIRSFMFKTKKYNFFLLISNCKDRPLDCIKYIHFVINIMVAIDSILFLLFPEISRWKKFRVYLCEWFRRRPRLWRTRTRGCRAPRPPRPRSGRGPSATAIRPLDPQQHNATKIKMRSLSFYGLFFWFEWIDSKKYFDQIWRDCYFILLLYWFYVLPPWSVAVGLSTRSCRIVYPLL